jgi:hypothetical protein
MNTHNVQPHVLSQPLSTASLDEAVLRKPEPFVSAEEAASFLGIKRRFLLSLARKGIAGAYALGTGDFRKTWIFRLSELSAALDPKAHHQMLCGSPEQNGAMIRSGSPR